MTPWMYQGAPIESIDQISVPKAVGFIYLITQISTGKKYIGKKLLTKASRKTTKGVTKKTRAESDWQDYWSSSPTLKEIFKEQGYDDFKREILVFAASKGSMVYCEELALYMVGALETDKWFNENIRAKVYRTWCKPDDAKVLREKLTELNCMIQ